MANETQNNKIDYTVAALKGALGAVPVLGAVLAEVVGSVIPNQRIDRLADFARKLDAKLSEQQKLLVGKRVLEPEGVDILEEALWQSARALTEERREHIAALVKSGLTKEQVDLLETKKLLQLLSQLNDLEVILLRYEAYIPNPDPEFETKFWDAIKPVTAYVGSSQEVLDKHAISENMRHHLVQLDLLAPSYYGLHHGQIPEFDSGAGRFKASSYRPTLLGRLLLRSIDFHPPEPEHHQRRQNATG